MNGQIAETAWKKLMRILDAEGVSSGERLAYARYMNDLLADRRKSSVDFPAGDEAASLLKDIRA